jgi:hypothetical protein
MVLDTFFHDSLLVPPPPLETASLVHQALGFFSNPPTPPLSEEGPLSSQGPSSVFFLGGSAPLCSRPSWKSLGNSLHLLDLLYFTLFNNPSSKLLFYCLGSNGFLTPLRGPRGLSSLPPSSEL